MIFRSNEKPTSSPTVFLFFVSRRVFPASQNYFRFQRRIVFRFPILLRLEFPFLGVIGVPWSLILHFPPRHLNLLHFTFMSQTISFVMRRHIMSEGRATDGTRTRNSLNHNQGLYHWATAAIKTKEDFEGVFRNAQAKNCFFVYNSYEIARRKSS